MLGNNYTGITRDTWVTVPGHKVFNTFDANNNILTSTFKDGDDVIFVQSFTYDSNNNCTSIVCTES